MTSMGESTRVTILVGNGTLTGSTADRPNGKPKEIGRILARSNLSSRRVLASHSPRVRNNWFSWPPIDTEGTMGTPALRAARTYPVRPPKSILFADDDGRYTS